MNTREFYQKLKRATALPDALFEALYRPLIERTLVRPDSTSLSGDIHRALLRTLRLRSSVVIPRGLHPEDAVRQHDMWSYAVLVAGIRGSFGFLDDETAAKQWIIEVVPDSARQWLQSSVAESLLLHCQGRTRIQDPILSIILRAFARENAQMAIRMAVDSIYARATTNETKHDRFGADLYFPSDCCVMTRKRFDALTFGALVTQTDAELIEDMNAAGIEAESTVFSISNAPDKRLNGLCLRRASALPPYPDLVFG